MIMTMTLTLQNHRIYRKSGKLAAAVDLLTSCENVSQRRIIQGEANESKKWQTRRDSFDILIV